MMLLKSLVAVALSFLYLIKGERGFSILHCLNFTENIIQFDAILRCLAEIDMA